METNKRLLDDRIKTVESAPLRRGKKEYLNYLKTGKISRAQSMNAKCYECIGFAFDGGYDCAMPLCPMYPFMPFKNSKQKPISNLSDETIKKKSENLRKARIAKKSSEEDLRRRR